ncbi:hypothetical protein GCM10023178_00260 [Actinomadura luteofluorescens]
MVAGRSGGLGEAADGSFGHGDPRVGAQRNVPVCADDREAGAGEGRARQRAFLGRSDGSTQQKRRLQTIQVTCYPPRPQAGRREWELTISSRFDNCLVADMPLNQS